MLANERLAADGCARTAHAGLRLCLASVPSLDPAALLANGVSGEIFIELSHPLLTDAVREALPRMHVTAAVAHGHHVRQRVLLPMRFKLLSPERATLSTLRECATIAAHRLCPLMIEIRPANRPDTLDTARGLVRAHIEALSSGRDHAAVDALVAALPGSFVPPDGGLWVAYVGGDVAGCAALQPLAAGGGEVKRMYVRPEHRGRGVARALATYVIDQALARRYVRLRLGTLTTMLAAQRLYASLGFRPIAPYRATEFGDTLFYELSLGDP